MISFFRARKYGLSYSIEQGSGSIDSVFTSTKWLLARWYLHGASITKITTVLSKVEPGTILIAYGNILSSFSSFDLFSILIFGPLRVKQLYLMYINKVYNFKSFKSHV